MASGHPVLDTMNPIDHGALRRLILLLEALLAMLFGHIRPTREPRKAAKLSNKAHVNIRRGCIARTTPSGVDEFNDTMLGVKKNRFSTKVSCTQEFS